MSRSLLASVLVLTQLLSSNASPLYLCIESDGSFCVDSGPENCDCCHSVCEPIENHFIDSDVCDSHPHGSPLVIGFLANHGACDCTHIQISQVQGPVVISATSSPETGRFTALHATLSGASQWIVVTGFDNSWLSQRPCPSALLPSVGLFSVIMRC